MKLAILLLLAAQEPSGAAKKAQAELDRIRVLADRLGEINRKGQALVQQARAERDPEKGEKLRKELDALSAEMERTRTEAVAAMDKLLAGVDEELKKTRDDWGLLEVRGNARLLKGDADGAVEDLEKSVQLKPGRTSAELRLGQALHAVNRFEDALRHLDSILKREPAHPEAHAFAGACECAAGRFEQASKRLGELLKEPDKLGGLLEFVQRNAELARDAAEPWKKEQEIRAAESKSNDLPRVKLTTSRGAIVVELFENEAPNTVANFVELAARGFYDGTKFHRVLPNFMAQGGDPNSKDADTGDDGQGGPGYRFADECRAESRRRHFRGSLSMANSGPDTNGSQFFLTHLPTAWLDGKHTVFGRVIEGQAVVDRLRAGDALEKVEVLRKRGHEYKVRKLGE